MSHFRFEDLDIWKKAIKLADSLFDVADDLEKMKFFRFAEQLRSSSISISNNIAEGSGSDYKKDFKVFLNYSRRSLFETVNMLLFLQNRGVLIGEGIDGLLGDLDVLSRQITSFKRTLQ